MELRMLNKFVIILLSLKVILVGLLEIRVMGEIRVGVEVGVGVGILRVLVIDIEIFGYLVKYELDFFI